MKELLQLQIPIPSLEKQQEIIDYCEQNDSFIKLLEKEIERNKTHAKAFLMSGIQSYTESTETIDEINSEITSRPTGEKGDLSDEPKASYFELVNEVIHIDEDM